MLTALVAVGIGLAVRAQPRYGRRVWLLPGGLWMLAVLDHMMVNYAASVALGELARTTGEAFVGFPGWLVSPHRVIGAGRFTGLLFLVLLAAAVILDYRALRPVEARLPALPGDGAPAPLSWLAERATALRRGVATEASAGARRTARGLAAALDETSLALTRASHGLVVTLAAASRGPRLWLGAQVALRERRELGIGLARAGNGPRRRRPPEEEVASRISWIGGALLGGAAALLIAAMGGGGWCPRSVSRRTVRGPGRVVVGPLADRTAPRRRRDRRAARSSGHGARRCTRGRGRPRNGRGSRARDRDLHPRSAGGDQGLLREPHSGPGRDVRSRAAARAAPARGCGSRPRPEGPARRHRVRRGGGRDRHRTGGARGDRGSGRARDARGHRSGGREVADLIDETAATFTNKEREVANLLAGEGKTVSAIAPAQRRTADALVDGIETEFNSLSPGASNRTVKAALTSAKGQARQAIVDARGSGLTEEEALRGLRRFIGAHPERMDGVRIVGDGFEVTWP